MICLKRCCFFFLCTDYDFCAILMKLMVRWRLSVARVHSDVKKIGTHSKDRTMLWAKFNNVWLVTSCDCCNCKYLTNWEYNTFYSTVIKRHNIWFPWVLGSDRFLSVAHITIENKNYLSIVFYSVFVISSYRHEYFVLCNTVSNKQQNLYWYFIGHGSVLPPLVT